MQKIRTERRRGVAHGVGIRDCFRVTCTFAPLSPCHLLVHELELEDRHLPGLEDPTPPTLAARTVSRHHFCFGKCLRSHCESRNQRATRDTVQQMQEASTLRKKTCVQFRMGNKRSGNSRLKHLLHLSQRTALEIPAHAARRCKIYDKARSVTIPQADPKTAKHEDFEASEKELSVIDTWLRATNIIETEMHDAVSIMP